MKKIFWCLTYKDFVTFQICNFWKWVSLSSMSLAFRKKEQKLNNLRFMLVTDHCVLKHTFTPFFVIGQQTNSTPEKTSMPQGKSMAKLLTFMLRSWHAEAAVRFHWSKSQHLVWLWMWSKRQCSGTNRASLWKAPAIVSNGSIKLLD